MKKFHPILFSVPMVQAILEDRKTMTRRTIKLKNQSLNFFGEIIGDKKNNGKIAFGMGVKIEETFNQKYKVGDVLWVRETWQLTNSSIAIYPGYVYRATDPDWQTMEGWTWKPSIYMPKVACRIFLEITDIKIERLQDIIEEDAIKEGVEDLTDGQQISFKNYLKQNHPLTAIASFQSLWQSINGIESWDLNPWLWVISFKRISKPENFNY